ncbi:NADH:ubiquinone oxidoreductase [Aquicoccus porphyridii]|uniref:NADH:ubiquinone oxidoreductase n=1 Tax=Aquicoccus porphyridii TaxID=1852029 RepID=A0A5A9ZC14_9RHOB|nr:NADH:ubiquinone oxidoreductase [Aquicoccus porphyridii]KAA0914747.1 NADH:ubiquinone oxidoreductase [Aquicoccus porphyridii]RAI53362.1 NADH:ubiquinone oxidoreductase [Rhodobacteraceae bacterium AsT-22]
MTEQSGLGTCGWVSWGVGIVAGILAYWMSVGAVTWLPALLIGISVAVFVGLILLRLVCGGSVTDPDADHGPTPAQTVASGAAEAGAAGATAMAAGATAMADKAENSADKMSGKAEDVTEAAAETAGEAAEAATDTAEEVAEKAADTAEDVADEAKDAGATAASTVADVAEEVTGTRPEALSAARDGQPDDLKQIKGIGPKLEKLCNELGFYHFDQIAGWTEDEVAWVDANLQGFKGRVSRDDWVGQAKTLAAGGETDFSQRVGKGEVY